MPPWLCSPWYCIHLHPSTGLLHGWRVPFIDSILILSYNRSLWSRSRLSRIASQTSPPVVKSKSSRQTAETAQKTPKKDTFSWFPATSQQAQLATDTIEILRKYYYRTFLSMREWRPLPVITECPGCEGIQSLNPTVGACVKVSFS